MNRCAQLAHLLSLHDWSSDQYRRALKLRNAIGLRTFAEAREALAWYLKKKVKP